jgi:hypothetical protein
MRDIRNLRLIPVIEVEPWRYDPDYDGDWSRAVARYGIVHSQPVGDTNWVRALDFRASELEGVVRKEWEEHGACSFYGGFAILDGEELIQEPQCCSCFQDLEDWDAALEEFDDSKFTIYIGHPWLDCARRGDWLECDLNEYGGRPFRFSLAQVPAALAGARAELELFRPHLYEATMRVFGHPRLAGLACQKLISYPHVDDQELDCLEVVAFFRPPLLALEQVRLVLEVLSRNGLYLEEQPLAHYGTEPSHGRRGSLEELWEASAGHRMLLRLSEDRPIYEIECDLESGQLLVRIKFDSQRELERFWNIVSELPGPFELAVSPADWISSILPGQYEGRFQPESIDDLVRRVHLEG